MSGEETPATRRSFRVLETMPDGVHKRKLEKIKKTLSHNADVKRSYRKTLKRMGLEVPPPLPSRENGVKRSTSKDADSSDEDKYQNAARQVEEADQKPVDRRNKKPKLSRYKREEAAAAKLRGELEAAQLERERREGERRQRIEQRQTKKKKMMQYTRTGQPKLGARVDVLLDKIRKIT
ncbi:hypothetical protein POJ06DRAFT_91247 [Lipomyces tetrasporus]|uniref:rRNA-processing protein FYV7 n=1 Tax=Lipomyces tetrasporus TaxID=54092 RepID=A0AAD7QTH5_9ASCO|nr:uncharacterized protein POJ06DRAFT_91247 [Lipomyces tetrasporus]KAJ8101224.1 hypothetical protein POJ06DRAFT_91247 [Lipomyces tetrasporus]